MQFTKVTTTTFCLFVLYSTPTYGNYSCVCNYNVEKSVFSAGNEQDNPIGYMYQFDCRQKLDSQQVQQGWFEIAFGHQIGYVKQDDNVQLQLCPGDPSRNDLGNTDFCSEKVRSFAQSHNGIVAQFHSNCYVLVKKLRHWSEAENGCNSAGGHLAYISSQSEQMFIYSFLRNHYNHSVWIGLNDRQIESHLQWSSGQQVDFVNTANHTHSSSTLENCFVIDMYVLDGKWDDKECMFDFYPYICQYGLAGTEVEETSPPSFQISSSVNPPNISSTATSLSSRTWKPTGSVFQTVTSSIQNTISIVSGNGDLCSDKVISFARSHHGVVAQFHSNCYVLVRKLRHWSEAEKNCNLAGGHLVHIASQAEQSFIYSLLRNRYNHSIWIGLNDKQSENHLQWSSVFQKFVLNLPADPKTDIKAWMFVSQCIES